MRDEGGFANAWKERGLFILVVAAFAAYVVGFFVAAPSGGRPAVRGINRTTGSWTRPGLDAGAPGEEVREERDQRFVRASGTPALPGSTAEVFARPEEGAYFDEALRRVWVEPRQEVVRAVMRLEPPPPVIPAPPMLLPVPGPALHATAGLPRWPAMPVPQVEEGEEAATDEEGAGAAREKLPRTKPVGTGGRVRPRDLQPPDERPRGETQRGEKARDGGAREERKQRRKAREGGPREKRPGRRRRPETERQEPEEEH